MQRREKILLAVLAAGLIVWWGWPVTYGLLFGGIDERLAQLQTLDAQVEQKENDQLKLLRATGRLKDWRTASLPADALDAQRLYQQWLTDLAQSAGFTEVSATPGRRAAQGDVFTGVTVEIDARATYEQLADFLRRFQQSGLLHRIVQMSVNRDSSDPGVLEVSLSAQGLALMSATQRDSLFPTAALAEDISADAKQIRVEPTKVFPQPPFEVRAGDEILAVTAVKGDTWSAARAAASTLAAAHQAGTRLELVLGGEVADRAPAAHQALLATNLFREYVPPRPHQPRLVLPAESAVVRGSELEVQAKVDDYDPAQGEPAFTLEGAPAGMTIDARSGTVTWTPADDFPLGTYEALVRARQQGAAEALTGTLRVVYREPNDPPVIDTLGPLAAYLGRTTEYQVAAHDPDGPVEGLKYDLALASPAGAKIDEHTGALTLAPESSHPLGDQTLKVRVTDSGMPPQTVEQLVTVIVTEDSAQTTYFTASVAWGDDPQAWLYDRAKNRRMVVRVGTEFQVADIAGRVVGIETDHLLVESQGATHRLALGQSLRALGSPEGERVPAGPQASVAFPPATVGPAPGVAGNPPAGATGSLPTAESAMAAESEPADAGSEADAGVAPGPEGGAFGPSPGMGMMFPPPMGDMGMMPFPGGPQPSFGGPNVEVLPFPMPEADAPPNDSDPSDEESDDE